MKKYSITYENELCSHCCPEYVSGDGEVELSDAEVDVLVSLVKEHGSTNADELGLKESHPALYDKLDAAYRQLATEAEEEYWLWEGYKDGAYGCDLAEVMDYCKANCGFTFEHDEADYLDADGNLDEEALDNDEWDAFQEWLDDYMCGLFGAELKKFCEEVLQLDVCLDDLEYTVEIPEEIAERANA
ncbi:MAG: hypothetical protein Q4B68_00130 [Bacteroidales bacterium]|nr:hypothetical protein [Bacteroidales bacterium]